jgi:hypothetical protein
VLVSQVTLIMQRRYFLIITAVSEGGTGLMLMFVPALLVALLLGTGPTAPDGMIVARIAGAALLAIGVACWFARNDGGSPSQLGLLAGMLIYDVAAAALLAYAGLVFSLVGIALWPAVVVHAALASWCVACIRLKSVEYAHV